MRASRVGLRPGRSRRIQFAKFLFFSWQIELFCSAPGANRPRCCTRGSLASASLGVASARHGFYTSPNREGKQGHRVRDLFGCESDPGPDHEKVQTQVQTAISRAGQPRRVIVLENSPDWRPPFLETSKLSWRRDRPDQVGRVHSCDGTEELIGRDGGGCTRRRDGGEDPFAARRLAVRLLPRCDAALRQRRPGAHSLHQARQ